MALTTINVSRLSNAVDRQLIPKALKTLRDESETRLAAIEDGSALDLGETGDMSAFDGSANAAGSSQEVAPIDHTHEITTRVRAVTQQITTADLTASAGSQVINLGAALPANAQVLGVSIDLATPFTGGGAASATADIGSSGDADALIDGADIFAAAVDGQASALTAGIAPNKFFSGSTQLTVTIAADVNVDLLTAGDMTARVLFAVP